MQFIDRISAGASVFLKINGCPSMAIQSVKQPGPQGRYESGQKPRRHAVLYGFVRSRLPGNFHPPNAFGGSTGRNIMQHVDSNRSTPQARVYDVVMYCRLHGIDEAEARKLVRLIGRFADRLSIQMNLTKRPVRFR